MALPWYAQTAFAAHRFGHSAELNCVVSNRVAAEARLGLRGAQHTLPALSPCGGTLDERLERRETDEQGLLGPNGARTLVGAEVEVVIEEGRNVVLNLGEALLFSHDGLEPLHTAEDDDEVFEAWKLEAAGAAVDASAALASSL